MDLFFNVSLFYFIVFTDVFKISHGLSHSFRYGTEGVWSPSVAGPSPRPCEGHCLSCQEWCPQENGRSCLNTKPRMEHSCRV